MKHLKFLTLILVSLSIISLASCKKDNTAVDVRDQYVGTWQYSRLGSLTSYENGQSIGTDPINQSGSMSITKSGDNDLVIDGQTFTVDGDHLSSDPQSFTETTNNGFNVVGTETDNGTLGSNIITINSSITGTWNNSNGASGNFSGSMTETLTK